MTYLDKASGWYFGNENQQNDVVKNALFAVRNSYGLGIKMVNDISHFQNMVKKVDYTTKNVGKLSSTQIAYLKFRVPRFMFHDIDSMESKRVYKYPAIIDPRGVVVISKYDDRLLSYQEMYPGINVLSSNIPQDDVYPLMLDIFKDMGFKKKTGIINPYNSLPMYVDRWKAAGINEQLDHSSTDDGKKADEFNRFSDEISLDSKVRSDEDFDEPDDPVKRLNDQLKQSRNLESNVYGILSKASRIVVK